MSVRKITQIFLTGLILAVPCAYAQNLIRNGSFEKVNPKTNLPADWYCGVNKKAPVQFSLDKTAKDGKQSLKIKNSMPNSVPNMYGMVSQGVKLEANKEYVFSFCGKGDPKSELILIVGRTWSKRFAFRSFSKDWNRFAVVIKLPASELDKNGRADFRINTDRFADVQIDDVKLTVRKPEAITNGKLEGNKGKMPWGWNFFVSKKAKCTAALNQEGKLLIKNESPIQPNLFGAVTQSVKLNPGQKYIVTIRYKSDSGHHQIALGVKWQIRRTLEKSLNWKTAKFEITAPQETWANKTIPFLLLINGVTKETVIESISIEPAAETVIPVAKWQDHKLYDVSQFQGNFATLTGIPKGLPVLTFPRSMKEFSGNTQLPSPEKLSAKTAFAFDKDGLIVMTEVRDDICRTVPGSGMWSGDSIQMRFDCGALSLNREAPADLELALSIDKTGKTSAWCYAAGPQFKKYESKALPASLCRLVGNRRNGNYFIAAHLPWKLLAPIDLNKQPYFGFSVIINDSDNESQRNVAFLSPGIHDNKYSNLYLNAFLSNGKTVIRIKENNDPEAARLNGVFLASQLNGTFDVSAVLTAGTAKPITNQIGKISVKKNELVKLPYSFTLPADFSGKYQISFCLNGKTVADVQGNKQSRLKVAENNMREFFTALDKIKKGAAALEKKGIRSEYLNVPIRILDFHLPKINNRFKAAKVQAEKIYYADQIIMITPECRELLAEMEANLLKLQQGKRLPEVWKYRSSKVHLKDGWPWAMAESESGKRAERPVVCIGYGHFFSVIREIAFLPKMAANTIQVEIGPSMLFPREGKKKEFEPDFSYLNRVFSPLFKKAWENNVQIVFLISPHYCPAWLMKKYPDINAFKKTNQGIGFVKYEQSHPKAMEMIHCYLNALIPYLKNHPYGKAIHSITISNEPSSAYCTPWNPVTVKNFTAWMQKKYGTVDKFNAAAGTKYASFAAVAAAESKDQAARFVFQNYVQDFHAEWHTMVANEVRRLWPGVLIHSKMMIFLSPYKPYSGIDPERWAEFSDLNGNDNYSYEKGPMNSLLLGHEIQTSIKKVTVADTEAHLIPDREKRPVSNDFIYASIFEHFITGAATIATWVYQDIDWAHTVQNPTGDLLGCIYMRPGNLAAHAKAAMDGMRLAPELNCFFQYDPEIALFYSSTSATVHGDSGCLDPMIQLCSQLAATGYRARVLTERQTAAGKYGRVKLLFIAGAPSITKEAAAGLKKFVQKGGKIFVYPDSLKKDIFGRPLKTDFPFTRLPDFTPEKLSAIIGSAKNIQKIPVKVSAGKEGMEKIIFRAVPDGKGAWLVHICNVNFNERKITLSGNGSWFDLIAQEKGRSEYNLKPNQLLLFRFQPK